MINVLPDASPVLILVLFVATLPPDSVGMSKAGA